jgi:hypothetical protein
MASICLVCVLIFPIIFLLPLDSHVEGFMASLAFALSVLLSIGFLFIPKAMVLLSSDYDDNALRIKMFNGNFKKKIDPLPRWTTVGGGGGGVGGGEDRGRGGGGGRGRVNVTAVSDFLPVFLSRFRQRIMPVASHNFAHNPRGDGTGTGTGTGSTGGAITNRNGRKINGKGNGDGYGRTVGKGSSLNRGGNGGTTPGGLAGGKRQAMLVDGAIEEGYEGAEIGEGDVDEGRQLGMSAVAVGAKELQRENSKRLLSVAEFFISFL